MNYQTIYSDYTHGRLGVYNLHIYIYIDEYMLEYKNLTTNKTKLLTRHQVIENQIKLWTQGNTKKGFWISI